MRKFLSAVLVAAFLMPIFSSMVLAADADDIYYQQFLEQFQAQYEEQLAAQIAALEEEQTGIQVTDYERALLERVAMNEAGNQGVQGMRYVVACVLNRVECQDPFFPDTIEEVIFQPSQFASWEPKYISDECRQAVELELQERSNSEIIFFCSTGYNYYGTPSFRFGDHWFSTL